MAKFIYDADAAVVVRDVDSLAVTSTNSDAVDFDFDASNGFALVVNVKSVNTTPQATITATTISSDAVDNSFNDSGAGFGDFNDGDSITVSGFTDGSLNGTFTIVTATASKLIVSADITVTEAAGNSVTIQEVVNTETYQFSVESLDSAGLNPVTQLEMPSDIGSGSFVFLMDGQTAQKLDSDAAKLQLTCTMSGDAPSISYGAFINPAYGINAAT